MTRRQFSLDDYSAIMKNCLEAWNKADAGLVASYYSDNLEYRDPTVPKGIVNKSDFIKRLSVNNNHLTKGD